MDNIIDRDPVTMERFAEKLSDFCDTMAQKSAVLIKMCDQTDHAMQDDAGRLVVSRLNTMAQDIQTQVATARALADRICRSAALLEQSEMEV